MSLGGRALAVWFLLALVACGSPPQSSSPGASPPVEPVSAPPSSQTPSPPPATSSALDSSLRARALEVLSRVVDREAGKPENAWALAHGLLARGLDFKASDGRAATAVLASDFLEKGPEGRLGFPDKRGDLPVEPHTDLVLKTLLELELPLSTVLAGDHRLEELLDSSLQSAEVPGGDGRLQLKDPNDSPWSVQAWCQAVAAGRPADWDVPGGSATLETLSAALLSKLESETWFIRQAMEAGSQVEKRKQGVFGYTCGGAHLFQGAVACAAAGWPRRGDTPARIASQVEVYLHRLPLETQLVDTMLLRYPKLAPLLRNQDIKFLGHLLEGLGKAQKAGLWQPTPAQRAAVDEAEARLMAQILALDAAGIYGPGSMGQFAATQETFQFYLDLVGDAAHALHGLQLQQELRLTAPQP